MKPAFPCKPTATVLQESVRDRRGAIRVEIHRALWSRHPVDSRQLARRLKEIVGLPRTEPQRTHDSLTLRPTSG